VEGRVLVFGTVAFDTVMPCDKFPEKNASTQVSDELDFFGGSAGNTAIALSKWGRKVLLGSVVGWDFPGSRYEKELKKKNVDISNIVVVKNKKTPHAAMAIDENRDMVSYFCRGAQACFDKLSLPKVSLTKKDMIHVSMGVPNFTKRVFAAYSGSRISFDSGYDTTQYSKEDWEFILPKTEVLTVNGKEMGKILAKIEKTEAKDLFDYGIKVLVVTHGARGSEIMTPSATHSVGVYWVDEVVDPIGAGDAYRAAFLHAYLKGESLLMCGRYGAAAASFAIRELGAQTGLETWEKIRRIAMTEPLDKDAIMKREEKKAEKSFAEAVKEPPKGKVTKKQ